MFYKQAGKYKTLILAFVALTLLVNLKIILFYSGCYGGSGYWDWVYYWKTLF
jgi:hypothetical protein